MRFVVKPPMIDNVPAHRRPPRPLTGILTVEWVDASDPDDASAPPSFGWFNCSSEPPLEPERLALLLHTLADSADEDVRAEREDQATDGRD